MPNKNVPRNAQTTSTGKIILKKEKIISRGKLNQNRASEMINTLITPKDINPKTTRLNLKTKLNSLPTILES